MHPNLATRHAVSTFVKHYSSWGMMKKCLPVVPLDKKIRGGLYEQNIGY